MAFAALPSLRPRDWRATIRVRVCCKWEYHGGTDDGPIQHVDLVLVDEQVDLSTYYWPLPISLMLLLLFTQRDTASVVSHMLSILILTTHMIFAAGK